MHAAAVRSGLRTTGRLAALEVALVGGGYVLGQLVGLGIVTGARIVDGSRARRALHPDHRRYPVLGRKAGGRT